VPIDWQIENFEETPSTQDVVIERAKTDASEGLVVHAERQLQGRGRHGRVWEAGDDNLYISFLLRPSCAASEVGGLSLSAGLALAQVIETFGVRPTLKWPNDVLIRDEKCAGILIDSDLNADGSMNWLVIGVGVNTACAPIKGSAVLHIDKTECRDRFLEVFGNLYKAWQHDGFSGALRKAWLEYSYKPGTQMSVKFGSNAFRGALQTVDEMGCLRLKDANGEIKTITAGEVYI